jgi:hypothetical protein
MNTQDTIKAAEQKLATAASTHSDAQAQLEQALATLKTEGTDKARKVVLAAEDALRLASIELGWAHVRVERAHAEHEQAEHAARVAEYEQTSLACSVDAFRAQAAPLAKRLADLARETAEITAGGAALSADFASSAAQTRSRAIELGLTPAPIPEFAKVFGAACALAAGKTPADVLALFFGVEPTPGVDAGGQLVLAFQGQDPAEVSTLLGSLRDAESRRGRIVRQLLVEGSGLGTNANPTVFGSFKSACGECSSTRARLAALGFKAVADHVSTDELADELEQADMGRAAKLIDRYRAADYERACAELGRRDSKAHAAEAEAAKLGLAQVGCPQLAAALPRARFANGGSTTAIGAIAAF